MLASHILMHKPWQTNLYANFFRCLCGWGKQGREVQGLYREVFQRAHESRTKMGSLAHTLQSTENQTVFFFFFFVCLFCCFFVCFLACFFCFVFLLCKHKLYVHVCACVCVCVVCVQRKKVLLHVQIPTIGCQSVRQIYVVNRQTEWQLDCTTYHTQDQGWQSRRKNGKLSVQENSRYIKTPTFDIGMSS